MRFLLDRWRRIGVRLYIALGFAVFLTLVSGATAVFYFEQSGDLNYELESESVPALEASWEAAREAERLRVLALGLMAEPGAGIQDFETESVTDSLERLGAVLDVVGGIPSLTSDAERVNNAANELAQVIDNLAANRDALLAANINAAELQAAAASLSPASSESREALSVLQRVWLADNEADLQGLWDQFSALAAVGGDREVASLGEGEGAFFIRGQQLILSANLEELTSDFDSLSEALGNSVTGLLASAKVNSSENLALAVSSFDEGRTLLTGISVISVIVATIAAWVWVGNGMVRRLSRMSDRMRGMADGDLETPVPEIGRDEIGELANALEVFRQNALEVQRLNLVEQLYEELRVTNEELKQAQARLVAQEKLAALGELVSGVAHEISNPLNFVKNFTEGSLDLYDELSEMLEAYKGRMSTDDMAVLDEISQEMTDSLNRVLSNGGRALAIVERMRGLGLVGGEPALTDLNAVLRDAVVSGYNTFTGDWKDFSMKTEFHLDSSVGEMMLVEGDFGDAIVNLVSNACFAMMAKGQETDDNYEPLLLVSSRLEDDEVTIRIRDNGPGIADDVLGHIFNPFFSTRSGAEGAGLGLPVAADVARRMGGDLSVDTEFGQYAEFVMTLPTATVVASS